MLRFSPGAVCSSNKCYPQRTQNTILKDLELKKYIICRLEQNKDHSGKSTSFINMSKIHEIYSCLHIFRV